MIEYALRELVRRKRRTAAHTAGYALSAAVITLVMTVLLNGQKASDAVLSGTGTHFIAFVTLCGDEACDNGLIDREHENFYAMNVKAKLLPGASLELVRTLDTVADAAFFLLFKLRNSGNDLGDVLIGGVPLPVPKAVATNSCSSKDLIEGRFLEPTDANAVVLEQSFAQSRFLKTGSALRLGNGRYTVVGIVNPGIRIAKADVYLPYERAREIINTRLRTPIINEANLILVESKNANVHEEAVAQVKRILGANGAISSYNCYQPASKVMGITGMSAFLITLIVFFCLLAFSLQSQYSRVVERRYDIGILKSIGWSGGVIIRQILAEALIQALIGWAVGSLVALLVFLFIPSAALVGAQATVAKQLFPAVFLFNLFLAAAGGMVAGFLPGLFAASQKPAVCLRRL
jgi:hypothetical protein